METLEKICEHCLAVCQVPIGVSEIYLRSRVESQFQYGRILDTDRVDGIESSRNLTRFVLLCSSAADVDHMCKEVKEEDIQIEDNHFTVKYQKAVSCEFPDRWDDFEILEPDNSQPQSSTDSTREPESHVGPELPPRRPKQQTPPHAWPQGPYGAMSGFYHNIPINPQGDADHIQGAYDLKMNQDDIRQQMHKFANAQAQPSMQGHEHQQDDPLGLGPQHGPQQMFQCDPGGQGQFQPGFSMFAMPQTSQPDKHNAPREQNMQFRPRMPMPFMVYDPQSRQMIPFPGPGFPGMPPQQAQEGSEPWRLPPQLPSGPPPPYNDEKFRGQGQSFEVKSSIDRPDYGLARQSQIIADQDEEMQNLQAKLGRENQAETIGGQEHGLQHGTINEEPEDKKEEPEMLVTDENQTKIVVSNLPSTVHEEYLEMYFENTRKGGGGPVFHVDINEENGTAIVEFENPEAVDIVLNKCPIKMMGQEVEVIVYKPEPPVPRCTIEVTGPCSIVCEEQLETLEMYFESFKRSGGGEVVDCRFDKENNMVLITFENEEVARRVEERVAHVVRKEKLNVALHVPTKLSKKLDKTKEEDEPEPPKTIKVKGVDKSASRDTVEFYFENSRQSGGGDIETIKSYEEDEDVIYITFKNQKDAIKVMERGHHKVDGKELSVSLYVPPTPPPTYENKILIKGLKSDTTYDCLYNFIQAKTGYEPDSMFWHAEQEDVVIITFSDNPDFQELEKIFGKTKLEGASLKVYQVPISSCIIVANLPSGVTKETIEFYFENTRKSGGGQVEKVVMNDDDTCLVYFADYSIIDKVLGRKHVLSKQQLGVKRYQECLGRPEGDICERKLNLPGPVKMKDICPQKQKFLKASKCYQEALEKHMQSCHARVVLPTDGADVTLKCAISEDVENCFTLVKTWKMEAEKCFDHFLNTIVVHQISVLQENWDKAVERLEPITRNVRDNVAVFLEKNDAIVTVVGNKHPVENVAKSIYEILLKIAEEAQIVKETFNSLKSLETRLLLVSKFPTTVEELIPEVKVKINQEKNEILFEGSRGNVRDAKLKLYEMKSKYVQRSLENISTLSAGLLKVKQTKQYIVNKFKMQQVTGVWEIQGQTLVIISTSEQTIDQCVSIIRASVMEQCVGLTKSSASVMNSEAWLYKVEEWHSQYAGKAHIAVDDFMTKVEICSTDDIANELLDSVKIFLGSNTVLEENIPCNKHLHKLIEKHHKNEISQICKELQSYHVSIISSEYNGCRICGTEDGIMKSKELLNKLFDKVKLKDRTVAKPDLVQQMKTHSVMDDLSATERSIPHVISLKDEWDKEQKCNILSTINEKRNKIKVKASCKAYANRKVYTAVGDIAEMPVQVLVSAADETINLSEGIGKALVLKGKLKADYIVHVIGPVWRGGENNEEDMLEETVFKCMQQASEKGATSMAIPAISCGAFGYPVKQGTKTIVKAMKNFFHEVQESRISDIYLCDVKCNTVDSFTDALKTEFDNIHIEDESEEKDNEPYVDLSPQSRSDYYSRQQMAEMGSDDVHNDEYYTSSDADKFVNSGRRKVEEKELDVALCNPPVPATSYKNKFLIKGLKPTTTQDCLFNFIEAKTGSIPQTMDHHAEQDGVVMVTFTESPDFQELEKVFEKNRLEGASLKLYTVPISNCITVANLASEVTKHTVVYYFENTEKSGGGQVEEVVMNDDQTCLVYFADFKLIDTILEKKHKLCGKHLNVKRYHDCLGRPEGEIAERMLRIPEDLVLKDVDPKKIKFMKHSNQNRSALEIQLDTFYTKIYWPDETGHVVLTCTLTRKVKDCFRLVKQWKETAEQNFRVFMKNIFVNKVPVLQDIWSKVMEELKTVTIDNPEAVAIFVDKNEGIITLVGNKRVTESLSKKIVFVRKKVMAEIEMEREKIKEVFTSLKLIETRMFLADKFPIEMEKLFPALKVKINQFKNEIVFEGPLGQVRDAKLKMYEMKSKFATASIDKISDLAARLFLVKQTKEHIAKKLKASHLTAVWDIIDGGLVVYSTSDEQIQDCFSVIRESVIENTIALKKASKTVVNSGLQTKVDELHAHYAGKSYIRVPENASKVQICATDDISNEIVDSLKQFLRLDTLAEVEKECETIKEVFTALKLIETKMLLADKFPAEMENLFPDLKVIINQNKNEIVFEGPLGQVRDAKLKMYEMKSRFASASIDKISDLAAGLFLLKQTNDHIVKKLKAYHLTAVWDIIDGGLVVYSTSVEQIQDCLSVIRGSVIENTIALKNASKTLVNSEGWHTKVDELHAHHTGKSYIKVSEDARKVQICATDDISNEIVDSLKKFLRLTTVTEVKVTCTKNVCRLIERHHKSELQNIAKVLQHSHIQIVSVPGYGGFEVHGTEDGIQKARSDLLALLKRVQQREYILSKPGLADHMQTPKGKDNLNTIESTLACVVSVKGDDYDEEILDDPYDTIPAHSEVNENIGIKGLKIIGYCKAYDCRNIYTAEGDMTELTVGMIVNLADDKLSLTGGLGKALVQKGGKEIQRECTEYIKYEGRLDDGDTFVSTAGKLKADFIVHVRGPVWRGGMMKEDEMLAEAVFKCLQQASTRSLTSVAMPAISCGTYGYPVRKATLTIVQAVKNFFREVQESTVTDIYLCDMKLNIVEAFNASLSNEFGGTDFQKYVLKQNERPRPAARKSASYDDEYEDNPYDIRPMDTDEEEDDDYYTSSSVMAPPRGRQPPLLPKGRPIKRSDSGASIGNIDVSVVKGEIARQKVDVIVNTTAKNLDLKNGAVSGSLLKTGGIKLQQEVSGKYPNGIKIGELAITSGQKLKCDVVIHSSMTNWDGSKDTLCKQALQKLVKDCMKEAEKQNKTSIAFPAIGTGNLGFPRDIVASEMLTAVSKFAKRNPVSSVRDVRFIVYQKDFQTIQAFEAEIERWASGKRGGIQRRKFNAYEDLQQGRRKGWWSGKEADDDQSSRPKGKKKPKTQTDPHTVTFIILAVSEDTINQAIKKLESCLEKDVHFKRFDDSIIMKMDDNQVMEIKAIARQFHLEMQLESAKGHIQISGIASNVMSASDKIHRIMRDAVSLEQAKHCAALMSNLVQWSYIETGETGQSLIPYDKDLNYKIETAYISKAPNVKFSSNKTKYVVDFNKMEEYPADDMTDVVTVLRRDLVKQGVFKLPLLWADMTGNLEVVVLPTASQEYQDVSQQCVASAGAGFTVVKVERVQNKTLWAQYQAKKKQLDDQNPPNTTNERLLWHGTAVETVDFINEFGFNRSYCGRNATMYGHGVYFAVSAQYTCRNTYSRPDPSGVKRMYYCRVLTGEFTQGKQGMRVPPNKGGAGSTALYDSVVDGPGSPGMFIIFHDTQAYPEYLVSFKPQ